MPAAFAEVHEPMIVEEGTDIDGMFAWVPDTGSSGQNCEPSNENCGYAVFTFACATDSEVGFEYEVRAPSGDDNLFGLQINDGPVYNWNIPTTQDTHGGCEAAGGVVNGDVCCAGSCGTCGGGGCGQREGGTDNCCVGSITRSEVQCAENGGVPPCLLADPWEWRRYDGDSGSGNGVNTFPVKAGNHKLFIHGKEDGVRLRNIRFGAGERGTCGFATELLLPDQQTGAFATVTPPMTREKVPGETAWSGERFLWTPDDGTLVDANGDGHVQEDGRCHGHAACGLAEIGFSCSGPSKVKFSFNVIATTPHTDSLFIQIDGGELNTWHIPLTETLADQPDWCAEHGGVLSDDGTVCMPAGCGRPGANVGQGCAQTSAAQPEDAAAQAESPSWHVCCVNQIANNAPQCFDSGAPPCKFLDPWQWRELHTVFDVDAGAHALKIITREDGTMTRDVRFSLRGTCGFAYEVMLPEMVAAQSGDLTPPMTIEDNFVYVPNGAEHARDGEVELGMMCGSADVVQFSFEVSAPNGNDDSFFVQLDDGALDTFHIPRTGNEGGAIGTGSNDDFGHACTHDNCENQVEVSCEALGGILGIRSSGSDVCCPAACGSCEGHGCSARGEDIPRLRHGGSACCPAQIARQAARDMAESDRCRNGVCAGEDGRGGVISSFCGDTDVTAPCAMPMEFEWRSFMFDFDVEPGPHSLYVKAREDGTKLRAVSFAQRGTCGWAPQLLLPRTVDLTWGVVTPPMEKVDDYVWTPPGTQGVGTSEDGSAPLCHPFNANEAPCGVVQVRFSCAGPSEIVK